VLSLGAPPPADGGNYGLPADVWCTGVLAYELLVGGPPFEADSKEATYARIVRAEPMLPPHLSEAARDFITSALRKNPAERPTAAALARHPWLRGAQRFRSVAVPHGGAAAAVGATAAAGGGHPAAPQGSALVAAYQGDGASGSEDEEGDGGLGGGEATDAKIVAAAAATAAAPAPAARGPPAADVGKSRAMSFGSALAGRFAPTPSKPLSLSAMKSGSSGGGGGGGSELAPPSARAPAAVLAAKLAAHGGDGGSPRAAEDSDLIRAEHGAAGALDPVKAPSLLQMLARPGAAPASGAGGRRRGSRILSAYLKKLSLGSLVGGGKGGEGEAGAAAGEGAKPSRLSVASKAAPPAAAGGKEQLLPV
jgi:hypothetical protein